MSIRHGLLALLDVGPCYGYQLRAEFERHTGGTWPLNVGQVYTTLGRLERDGCVVRDGEDEQGHVHYRITEAGRAELRAWFDTPVDRRAPARDELAIKLALALTVPGVDVRDVVQRQRRATMTALRDYTRLKAREGGTDLAWSLVLDSLVFAAEAEIRWLDHCEAQVVRAQADVARRRSARGAEPVVPEGSAPTTVRADRREAGR